MFQKEVREGEKTTLTLFSVKTFNMLTITSFFAGKEMHYHYLLGSSLDIYCYSCQDCSIIIEMVKNGQLLHSVEWRS